MNDKIEFCGLGHINIVVDDIDEGISFIQLLYRQFHIKFLGILKMLDFQKQQAFYQMLMI